MIRVLLVPSSDYLGHPFPQRHNQIFERLHDNKHFEVHVVRFKLFEKKQLETKLIVHELNQTKKGLMAAYYLLNMFNHASEIRRIIRQEKIDVVILSNIAAPLAYTLMDELSCMKVPVIFDLPDYYPTSAAGYLFDVKSTNGKILTGTFDFMVRRIIKYATAVTAASSSLVNYAKMVGSRNTLHVPNGISETFLKLHYGQALRNKLAIDDDEFVVGYLGSLEFWLDMENLIKGVSMVRDRGIRVKLLIIGKGLHTNYPQKMEKWLKNDGLTDSTVWLDFVPYNEVPVYLASFNVGTIPFNAFNPTAYYAAPNKMWEYFSQMIPVISAPIPEAISNNDCVLLASSPQQYCQKLMSITEEETKIAFKIQCGYNKALKNTWDNSSRMFGALICRLLDRETFDPTVEVPITNVG